MSGCCARHGQEELFGDKLAARAAARYRRRGPDRMAKSLARRAAGAGGAEGASVLEVGGGIGEVLFELVAGGAERGEVVELVPSWEPHVQALARERGLEERISFRTADLVADPAAGREADLVVLNRVVCCTPDGVELAGIAAGLARRTLAYSHPREAWWARLAFGAVNLGLRIRGNRFRVFVHPRRALDDAVEARGFTLVSERDGPLFRVAAFERA